MKIANKLPPDFSTSRWNSMAPLNEREISPLLIQTARRVPLERAGFGTLSLKMVSLKAPDICPQAMKMFQQVAP